MPLAAPLLPPVVIPEEVSDRRVPRLFLLPEVPVRVHVRWDENEEVNEELAER
jgi:hypothetical protein